MFNLIQKFIIRRSFKIKINKFVSDTKVQPEGIPKGRVVGLTFFILKTNKIVAQVQNDNRFHIALHTDDLLISYCHPNWRIIERKLKDGINIFEKFTQKNGFKFSTSKTYILNFTKLSITPPLELRFGNDRIQKCETVKYLGLVFDSKLDWKAHIQQ